MYFINLFITAATICIIILVARHNTISSGNRHSDKQSLWDRELKANSVRRADISSLEYIRPELEKLPLNEACSLGCSDLIDRLKALCEKRIINLSSYTNTDLKMMYGPANLDELTEYDNNYTTLIRLLNSIGDELLEKKSPDTAKLFFEYGISIGSDITNTYVKLGQIYLENGAADAFDSLLLNANKISSLSGPIILTKLNNIKSAFK